MPIPGEQSKRVAAVMAAMADAAPPLAPQQTAGGLEKRKLLRRPQFRMGT